ncbi:Bardet-Biedl syndrome 10 protein [Gadus chalcogrammus]|uniref:Bardet-Biedl syndrome 10 protein n=1 Tax=Gadus chalcogrammus TaxID=1042646 RepID=UPI0024C4BDBB|nr:Bardet-Biedl syndrome 10 protein [Gadus chalcogrammus]
MQQVEHLHLKHVVQTVCVLEAVILRSFGPEGGQVLFTRDTGQLMLSRSGKQILTALRLDHPLARMVVECVWKHSENTGDGSKTFILLLASLLRGIQTAASKGSVGGHVYTNRAAVLAAGARRTAEELLAFGLEELAEVILVGVVPHTASLSWESGLKHRDPEAPPPSDGDPCPLQRLLATFFYTRLGRTHGQLTSRLTRDLISLWRPPADPPALTLRLLERNFGALHTAVCGLPAGGSRLVEGQVIHRDFAVPPRPPQPGQREQPPVRAVALVGAGGSLQPNTLLSGTVLQVGSPGGGCGGAEEEAADPEGGVLKYSAWAERSLEGAVGRLRGLGVTLLLSAGRQTQVALAAARRAGLGVVECVEEEELALFAQLSGATPAAECGRVGREHVGVLSFCKPIVLGAHRYVHVGFPGAAVRPHSLVLCGAGEGQAEQGAGAVRDALRMLLAMWEPWQRATEDEHAASPGAPSHPRHPKNAQSRPDGDGPSREGALDPRGTVPAGGEFEFLLHRALMRHGEGPGGQGPGGVPVPCRLLADALLTVPRHVYSQGPRRLLQAQTLSLGRSHSTALQCDGVSV